MKSSAYKEYFGATCLVQLRGPIAMAVPTTDLAQQQAEFNQDNELRVAVSEGGIGVRSRSYYPAGPQVREILGEPDPSTVYTGLLVARIHAVTSSDEHVALAYEQKFNGETYLVTTVVAMDMIEAVSYIGSKKAEPSRIVAPAS
jgi:hypothetical protein